jgi:hypothetical protein
LYGISVVVNHALRPYLRESPRWNTHIVDAPQHRAEVAWRVRFGIAVGLAVMFAGMVLLGLARTDWVFAGILAPFLCIAIARLWLMAASRQPISFLGTVVILLNGPRRFIAESGVRKAGL